MAGIPLVLVLAAAGAREPVPAGGPVPRMASSPDSGPEVPVIYIRVPRRTRPPLVQQRNPFQFAEVPRPAQPSHPVPRVEAPAIAAAAPAAPLGLTLIGIAGERTTTGMNRMAMIVDGQGTLQLARVGDVPGGRYEVLDVSAARADVKDLVTGLTHRLRLQ